MDGGGALNVYGNSTNYFRIDGGSFEIKSDKFDLDASTIIVDSEASNGKIALGATPPSHASSSTGFYADGEGTFMVGNSSGNRMQYLADGTIYLQSTTFTLNASTLVIDSATNSGKIALGASPNTSVAGTNAGIYMDGGGNFLAYGDANNYLRKSGTGLDIKAQTFDLQVGTDLVIDSSGKSISLANGNITLDGDSNSNVGHIEAGGLSSTATNQTAAGVYIKGDGEFLAKATAIASQDYLKFSSSGLELKTAALTFETNGDITSDDFLIERTRLFGFGSDGNVVLQSDDCTFSGGSGSAARTNSSTIKDARGDNVCTRSGDEWTMQGDWYTDNLEIDDANGDDVYLNTNGFRLFVRKTLTIDSNCTIRNNGTDGQAGTQASNDSGGMGGAGGVGGSLGAGTKGTMGGRGGTVTFSQMGATEANGVKGGGGGGSGGIIFISAKTIVNNGSIASRGGRGGAGAQAGVDS